MIIGICGSAGAGKDTAADYLVQQHQFVRDSFAASLKDAVAAVFGWDRELLEGQTEASRSWRETVDPWWADRLALPTLTPRQVLQIWGTEVCRQGYHDDIWIASLEQRLNRYTCNVVISDVRFPNEIRAIKQAGGRMIVIKRGPEPDWYQTALGANIGIAADQEQLQQLGIHASETAWIGTEFDQTFENNSTREDLYSQLDTLIY